MQRHRKDRPPHAAARPGDSWHRRPAGGLQTPQWHRRPAGGPPGFTLVETLVVITILLVLTAATLAAVNFTLSGERIGEAARQVQSYLEGARTRAMAAGQPRGVRFLLDETPNASGRRATVTSLVYVAPAPPVGTEHGDGRILLERPDFAPPLGTPDGSQVTIVRGMGTPWYDLKQKGLLSDGARLTIIQPDGFESNYRVRTTHLSPGRELLELTTPYRTTGGETPANQVAAYNGRGPTQYRLELPPAPLPSEEPVLLPRDIVVDLDRSRVPGSWQSHGGERQPLDILFTPRGTVTGATAAAGLIHLVLSEAGDADAELPLAAPGWQAGGSYVAGRSWIVPGVRNGCVYRAVQSGVTGAAPPAWPTGPGATVNDGSVTWQCFPQGEKRIVSVFPQTGNISAQPVYESQSNQSVDPFRYAEAVEVTSR